MVNIYFRTRPPILISCQNSTALLPLDLKKHSTVTMTSNQPTGSDLATRHASAIKGKVVLTTGVTLGTLGSGFVLAIARAQPSLLILAGRSRTKNQETAQAVADQFPGVKVRTLELDLVSLAAVHAAADTVNAWADVPRIDVLVNNAGVMATDWALSPDGFESQLAINHLGHFLFTNLIIGKILKSPAPRIIIVSSNGHRLGPFRFDDYNFRVRRDYWPLLYSLPPFHPLYYILPLSIPGIGSSTNTSNATERRMLQQVVELRPIKNG